MWVAADRWRTHSCVPRSPSYERPGAMISVFIISAPSGSGKSTLVHRLLTTVPNLTFSISYTTRPPRPTETNGVDYVFISREEFEERLARSEFLEYAEVFGNYYGTNRETFERAVGEDRDLVLDIDVQGARQLKVAIPEAISVFVLPPSRDVLEQRLRARSQDSEEVIQRRLKGAAAEVRNYTQYDYVLINREIEESAARLESIVKAERLRKARMEEQVRPILESFERQ
jgi:guanylate kinase